MPRETSEAKLARTKEIIAALRKTYPDAHCELNYSNPLELLIATVLSAQCTDKRVNQVTAELFRKYRTAADYANANTTALEQDVKTTGFFRNKTKSIQACCRKLVEQYGGKVPQTMEELVQLGGVGRKTANVVLRPTPPSWTSSSIVCGTLPPYCSTSLRQQAWMLFVLFRKKPVVLTSCSSAVVLALA